MTAGVETAALLSCRRAGDVGFQNGVNHVVNRRGYAGRFPGSHHRAVERLQFQRPARPPGRRALTRASRPGTGPYSQRCWQPRSSARFTPEARPAVSISSRQARTILRHSGRGSKSRTNSRARDVTPAMVAINRNFVHRATSMSSDAFRFYLGVPKGGADGGSPFRVLRRAAFRAASDDTHDAAGLLEYARPQTVGLDVRCAGQHYGVGEPLNGGQIGVNAVLQAQHGGVGRQSAGPWRARRQRCGRFWW